ncbi:hypothetical protein [Terricaulis sp.]|uniref:hypothetical protein n=1 Tax=Terricaulis sp. TaxID=2768686 RepID=UPI002AC67812|nr:hypothetical protein [Terricaulis sp.]MDZ4692750.1 hypothetical protein [Terricaulis sp.]
MTANTADFGSNALSALLRALGLVALAIGAALAFFFAFAAAVIVALMVSGAAIAMRLRPRRRDRTVAGPEVLDAHRTPSGWVVETAAKRKS